MIHEEADPARARTTTMSDNQLTMLNPPTTVTSGEDMTRADYHRWMVEEANFEQAKETRAEREDRRRFRTEQQKAMQNYGKELAAAQRHQQQNVAATREGCRQEAAQAGVEGRYDQQMKRSEREALQAQWAEYGKALVKQFCNEPAKESRAELHASKAAMVKEVKDQLNRLEHGVGVFKEDRVAANRLQVGKVKSETADHITRQAKKMYVDERWDVADSMREDLDAMRQERIENETAYLHRAKTINRATSNEPARAARRKMYEQRLSEAQQVRHARQNVGATDRDQRVADASAKQAVHAQIHASKFVPVQAIKATPERLKPYFSFRSPARRQKPHEVRL